MKRNHIPFRITIAFCLIVLILLTLGGYRQARREAQRLTCINSLRVLDEAKQRWAQENHKQSGDPVRESDLTNYFASQVMPRCEAGGQYTIGPVGALPTCSIPGHELDPGQRLEVGR